jgi:hypothetical protein
MPGASTSFDASSSALGYLHQCRCALLLALQRDDGPNLGLSIEKFDDIALHDPNIGVANVVELRQHKLHLSRQGKLGDMSLDIWKTLRIWAEAVLTKQIDLDRVQFCLVTTSVATDQNSARWLRPSPHPRQPDEARQKLEQAGAASTNAVVALAHATLQKLTTNQRENLFNAIFLLDGGLDATAVRQAINRCIWSACIEKHRDAFIDRLEGWWINLVVQHLSEPRPDLIPIHVVQSMVHEIGAHFRRESLPDDLLDEPIPDGAITANNETNFVRQLALIGISPARMRLALEDHYRAFTQRSKWAKEQLLGFDEETKFESRLVSGWHERFLIMAEAVPPNSDDPILAHHGSKLYEWFVTDAPAVSQLRFRPDFQSEYMTKGSYHMLADKLRVGWHPHYEVRLAQPPPPAPEPTKKPKKRKGASK